MNTANQINHQLFAFTAKKIKWFTSVLVLMLFCLIGQATAQTAINQMLTASAVPSNLPNTGLTPTFAAQTNPSTFVPYAYVVQAINPNASSSQLWTINETLPTGFIVNSTGCKVFIGNAPAVQCSSFSSSEYSVSGLNRNWKLTGINATYITVVLEGLFDQTSIPSGLSSTTVGHTANATVSSNPNPNPTIPEISTALGVNLNYAPPSYNLRVVKTATPTSFPGNSGSITYSITVSNTGTAALPSGYTALLFDNLNNPSSSPISITGTSTSCTGTGCVTPPALASTTLTAGSNYPLFGSTGLSIGQMFGGQSFTLSYTLTALTGALCATSNDKLNNYAYITLGSTSGNVIDSNTSDNTSSTVSTSFHSVNVCPSIPAPTVSKRIMSTLQGPIGSGEVTVGYQVKVTNNSVTNPIYLTYNDYVNGVTPIPTVFSVTPTTATGMVNLGTPPTLSSLSNVGSATQAYYLISGSGTAISLGTMGSSTDTFTLTYTVKYKALCPQTNSPMKIVNTFHAITNTNIPHIHSASPEVIIQNMPPPCKLVVSKSLVRNPTNASTPLNFGSTMGTYSISWTNTSATNPVTAGIVRDTLSLDSSSYATTPVGYTNLNCSGAGVAGAGLPISSAAGPLSVNYAAAAANGSQVVNLQNITFAPNSTLTCTYDLKVNQPLAGQANCQSSGNPQIRNFAMADPDPAFNTNWTPLFSSNVVSTLLPLCSNISLTKNVQPTQVLPGAPVVWTITATNNAPTINTMFSIADIINPLLLPVSIPTCSVISGTGTVTSCSAASMMVSSLSSGGVVKMAFTSASPTYPAAVQNTVTAVPNPGIYFQNGASIPADATLVTAWPALSKKFTPQNIISGAIVQLTFTVTNLGSAPAVSGLSFTDTLSPGLLIAPGGVTGNTCGGAAPVAIAGTNAITWTGGALAAGQASCTFTIEVMQTDYTACPASYVNKNTGNISNANHLDTSTVNASLTVKCNTEKAMLKICKIAGDGIPVGTVFSFNVGGVMVSVPAGPAPGGTCVVAPTFATGANVTVTEVSLPYYAVTNIVTVPAANQTSSNLSTGSVNLTLNPGVTEINYTNQRLKGYIEICKKVLPPLTLGNYTFMVNGTIGPFTVAAGTCTHAIQVPAGPVVINETGLNAAVASCSTYPAGFCSLGTSPNTVNVNVVPGGIASQTVVEITNKKPGPCLNCTATEGGQVDVSIPDITIPAPTQPAVRSQ